MVQVMRERVQTQIDHGGLLARFGDSTPMGEPLFYFRHSVHIW